MYCVVLLQYVTIVDMICFLIFDIRTAQVQGNQNISKRKKNVRLMTQVLIVHGWLIVWSAKNQGLFLTVLKKDSLQIQTRTYLDGWKAKKWSKIIFDDFCTKKYRLNCVPMYFRFILPQILYVPCHLIGFFDIMRLVHSLGLVLPSRKKGCISIIHSHQRHRHTYHSNNDIN